MGGCGQKPKIKRDNNILRMKTAEIETLRRKLQTKEEKEFLDIAMNLKKEEDCEIKNVVLTSEIYFELLNYLQKNQVIKSLSMNNINFLNPTNVLTQLYHSIKGKNGIKKIELKYLSNLGNKKGKSLCKICQDLPNLEHLELNEIELEEEDAEYLGGLLIKCKKLTYFDIKSIYFFDKTNYFLDGINANNSIKELYLNRLGLKPNNFEFLISALQTNFCLEILDVSDNDIGRGVSEIKKHPLVNLTDLLLNNCGLDGDDFGFLCEGLEESTTLKNLEVKHNQIKGTAFAVSGVVALFKKNKVIQRIVMFGNPVNKGDIEDHIDPTDYGKIAF